MKSTDIKKYKLPDSPGVYFFLGTPKPGGGDRKILYIGKATNLKDRAKSYFVRNILTTRSPLIAKMLEEANKITFTKTDSVLEALILEANLIKKHQPLYNSKEKDDKSYNYITITEEDFPRIIITRGSGNYGPFPYGGELKEALKIIRKIFPYRDKCKPGQNKPCFNAQLGLCPGVCAGSFSETEYRKIIRHIKLFFEGKKLKLIRSLGREMKILAKEHKFEEADRIKKQMFALGHIQDIALIKQNLTTNGQRPTTKFRIEAYDIAHISGAHTVGVMTVVEDGELNKNQYRKFKIRLDSNNDITNLKEVLTRRLTHQEWPLPNLIVVDGGKSQINIAQKVIKKANLNICIVSVVKDEKHKARNILGDGQSRALTKLILLANAEAHRFAIGYHRKLRGEKFGV